MSILIKLNECEKKVSWGFERKEKGKQKLVNSVLKNTPVC